MKEFIIFVCTDSTEIFSKLRSAGLNNNLPCFFTDSYCAGVSNKHCLLIFFIILADKKNNYKSLNEFEFRQDPITYYGVSSP